MIKNKTVTYILVPVFGAVFIYFIAPHVYIKSYNSNDPQVDLINEDNVQNNELLKNTPEVNSATAVIPTEIPVSHIETPQYVKAIYISSWVAGTTSFRDKLIKMVDDTELNAVVIDVKDSTGKISFSVKNPELIKEGSAENRIANIRALTNLLHSKNIYIIGRVSVFQDPYMTGRHPEWAVKKKSDGSVWKDRKGLSFLDPANEEVWKYTVAIAEEAYNVGFDEINFDYIRYPSDGDIKDINYNLKEGEKRSHNLKKFFEYLEVEMTNRNIPTSADLFGLTTVNTDDLGIGQVLEDALPHFDFIAPMVYPSHYASGWNNFKKPADHPYEVIHISMSKAVERAKVLGEPIEKLRPWIQDFDLGSTYTKEMVRDQIKATYDSGLTSWMLWDPSNKYTPEALLAE